MAVTVCFVWVITVLPQYVLRYKNLFFLQASFPLFPYNKDFLPMPTTTMKYTTTTIASLAALVARASAASEPSTFSTVTVYATTTLHTTIATRTTTVVPVSITTTGHNDTNTVQDDRLMAPNRTQTLSELIGTIITDDASTTDPALESYHKYMSTYSLSTATANVKARYIIHNDGAGERVKGAAVMQTHNVSDQISMKAPSRTQTMSESSLARSLLIYRRRRIRQWRSIIVL